MVAPHVIDINRYNMRVRPHDQLVTVSFDTWSAILCVTVVIQRKASVLLICIYEYLILIVQVYVSS